jgi:hypothetical protein
MTEDRVENEFYGQLWSCPEGISQNQYTKPQTLVWIRRDLFEQRRFSEQDFFPRSEGDRADELKVLSLRSVQWLGGRKSSLLRLQSLNSNSVLPLSLFHFENHVCLPCGV